VIDLFQKKEIIGEDNIKMANRYSKQNNKNETSNLDYVKNLREELRGKADHRKKQFQDKYGNTDEVYQKEINEIIENVEENKRDALVDLVKKLEDINLKQEDILRKLKDYKKQYRNISIK
jgi:histidinol dehydrogenase